MDAKLPSRRTRVSGYTSSAEAHQERDYGTRGRLASQRVTAPREHEISSIGCGSRGAPRHGCHRAGRHVWRDGLRRRYGQVEQLVLFGLPIS